MRRVVETHLVVLDEQIRERTTADSVTTVVVDPVADESSPAADAHACL